MEILLERLSNPTVAIPILLLVLHSIYGRLTSTSSVPAGVPWVGKDSNKLFAETRATFGSFNNVRKWLEEGYQKVNSVLAVISCGLPSLVTSAEQVE